MGGWEVVILDPQLWAKIPKWLVVELFSIVRNQYSKDPVPANDISLDKVSYVFLHNGGECFSFHLFGKVIYTNH